MWFARGRIDIITGTRNEVVDFVNRWTGRGGLPAKRLFGWPQLGASKFQQGKQRHGKVNECPRAPRPLVGACGAAGHPWLPSSRIVQRRGSTAIRAAAVPAKRREHLSRRVS